MSWRLQRRRKKTWNEKHHPGLKTQPANVDNQTKHPNECKGSKWEDRQLGGHPEQHQPP
jgi:hypothetical protein